METKGIPEETMVLLFMTIYILDVNSLTDFNCSQLYMYVCIYVCM